jgi:hypothetical protein
MDIKCAVEADLLLWQEIVFGVTYKLRVNTRLDVGIGICRGGTTNR